MENKSQVKILLLCIFLGIFGIHRFYQYKITSGLIYLFTAGIIGIGYIYDLITIIYKMVKDRKSKQD